MATHKLQHPALGMHFNPSATPAFAASHLRADMFLAMRQACNRAREYGVLPDPYALCHLTTTFVLPLGLCHLITTFVLPALGQPGYGALPSLGTVCGSPTQCKHACSAFSGLLPGYVVQCQA
ncbi:hypothetical protein HaLaN_09550, partial [Haematococcus lacustris]